MRAIRATAYAPDPSSARASHIRVRAWRASRSSAAVWAAVTSGCAPGGASALASVTATDPLPPGVTGTAASR